ncbi:MAG: hypothetical protein WC715_00365 [Patescibacteria group bacterium]|jgi:hypothetical protein
MEKIPNQREIFLEKDIAEPEEQVRNREQKFIDDFVEMWGRQNLPEWESFFDKIDFNLLRDLFSELEKKCGITADRSNFIWPEKIISSEATYSNYDGKYNLIKLRAPGSIPTSPESEKKYYYERLAETYGTEEMNMLHTIVHEEAHAISKNICVGLEPSGHHKAHAKEIQSGYHNNDFGLFNEGVTEKIAREILEKYLNSSGWSNEEKELYRRNRKINPEKFTYSVEVTLVDAIIKKLAIKNKLPKDQIWNALKRGFIEGERIMENKEIVSLFKETFGRDFLTELKRLTVFARMFTGEDYEFARFNGKYKLGLKL